MRITRRRLRKLIHETVLTEEVLADLGIWNKSKIHGALFLVPTRHRGAILGFLSDDLELTDDRFYAIKDDEKYEMLRDEIRDAAEVYMASGEDTGGDSEPTDDALDIMLTEFMRLLQKYSF
jgi:hypothetical protein